MNKWIGVAVLGLLAIVGMWLGMQLWTGAEQGQVEEVVRSKAGDVQPTPQAMPTTTGTMNKAESITPPFRRLVGVIAKGPQYSHAVIADAGTQEQVMYQTGDAVAPDNAELVSIHEDHVVLNGPGYGHIELRLQSSGEDDWDDDSDTTPPEYPEDIELDRQLEEAFGPDPYLACELYTTGAEEEACEQRIDAEIDRRIEACDDVEDKDEYSQCLDRAQALQ